MSSKSGQEPPEEVELFRFFVPGKLAYRDAARAFLAYVCDQLGQAGRLAPDMGHRVISSFVEGFNNAVIHAYKGVTPGPIEVVMEVTATRLRVQIADEGRTFSPEDVPEPDLESLPEGGLGLFIMKNFMDAVHYERIKDRNVLTMEKALRAETSPMVSEKG